MNIPGTVQASNWSYRLISKVEDLLENKDLLDAFGLYTTEVHQQAREDVIERQQREMLELSTPVVKLWDGILALPLIVWALSF